jgi:hypothetical protein
MYETAVKHGPFSANSWSEEFGEVTPRAESTSSCPIYGRRSLPDSERRCNHVDFRTGTNISSPGAAIQNKSSMTWLREPSPPVSGFPERPIERIAVELLGRRVS